jgi:hypothetical protein
MIYAKIGIIAYNLLYVEIKYKYKEYFIFVVFLIHKLNSLNYI